MINTRLSIRLATVMTACASVMQGQRYRIELAVPNDKVAIAEFSPCIGADDSDCGAWVDRTADALGVVPALATHAVSPNGHDSVFVENGRVRITPLDGRKPPFVVLRIGTGVARGLAISADSRYVFVVVANPTGNPADVMMIDLATQSGIAGLDMETRVLGIRVAP